MNLQAIIDGEELEIKKEILAKEIELISGRASCKIISKEKINYLEPKENFKVEITLNQQQLKPGERCILKIIPEEKTYCPVAKIYLPGNLAFLKSGTNIQSMHLPIKNNYLSLEAAAIRKGKGKGKINIIVYDMYDENKITVRQDMWVEVG